MQFQTFESTRYLPARMVCQKIPRMCMLAMANPWSRPPHLRIRWRCEAPEGSHMHMRGNFWQIPLGRQLEQMYHGNELVLRNHSKEAQSEKGFA